MLFLMRHPPIPALRLGNHPLFHQSGKNYPDNCYIEVPFLLAYDEMNPLSANKFIIYYAPWLKRYVMTQGTIPVFASSDFDLSRRTIMGNYNGKAMLNGGCWWGDYKEQDGEIKQGWFYMSHNTPYNQVFAQPGLTFYQHSAILENWDNYGWMGYAAAYLFEKLPENLTEQVSGKLFLWDGTVKENSEIKQKWSFSYYERAEDAIDISVNFDTDEYPATDRLAGKWIQNQGTSSAYVGMSIYGDDVYGWECFPVREEQNYSNYINIYDVENNRKQITTEKSIAMLGRKSEPYIWNIRLSIYNYSTGFSSAEDFLAIGYGDREKRGGYWRYPKPNYSFFKFQETQSYTFDFVRVNDNGADYQPITINYKGSSLEPNLYRRAKQGLHLPVYLMNGSATLK